MKEFFGRQISFNLIGFTVMLIITIVIFSYGGYSYYLTQKNLTRTKEQFQATSQNLQNSITDLEKHIASTTNENIFLNDFLAILKARNTDYQNEVAEISQRASTLEKLKNTDPELLQKYSKIFFLNENYTPSDLAVVAQEYVWSKTKPLQIHTKIKPYLETLVRAARAEGVDLSILSGYRSFGTQAELKSQYSVVYGTNSNKFSADQGYSEHQLGTTVDFTTKKTTEKLTGFDLTPAYKWLGNNAYKYGFVLSYPANNKYYVFEPWHWRFVGVVFATELYNQGKNFYDLPERDIDAYLINFFD